MPKKLKIRTENAMQEPRKFHTVLLQKLSKIAEIRLTDWKLSKWDVPKRRMLTRLLNFRILSSSSCASFFFSDPSLTYFVRCSFKAPQKSVQSLFCLQSLKFSKEIKYDTLLKVVH
jgi:hypothetical protein